jgi:hypothetical protein
VQIRDGARTFFRAVGSTDANGQRAIAEVPEGPFTVRAFVPGSLTFFADATGTMTAGGTVGVPVGLPPTGFLQGRVLFARGLAASSSRVQVLDDTSAFFDSQFTVGDGSFSFLVPAGRALTVEAAHPLDGAIERAVTGLVVGDGTTLVQDVTLPARASVQVTVLRNGQPVVGARIELQDSAQTFPTFRGTTSAQGQLVVPGIREGAFTVRARDGATSQILGEASGTVRVQDDNGTVFVAITVVALTGAIEGTVTGAAGTTPVPSAFVSVLDPGGTSLIASGFADAGGFYRITGVTVGSQGFRVRASTSGATAEATGAFTAQGETVRIDFEIPGGVVAGRAFFFDGVPLSFGSVFVVTAPSTVRFGTTDASGSYRVFGVPAGDFAVTAQEGGEGGSGLSATATGRLDDVAVPLALPDLVLPPTGTVRGVVRGPDGNPAGVVGVVLEGGDFDRFATTNGSGEYEFQRVPLGAVFVEAVDFAGGLTGSAVGALTSPGEELELDIMLLAQGTVTGRVLPPSGNTGVAGASVTIEGLARSGTLGPPSQTRMSDPAGGYIATTVPVGPVRVTAVNPAGAGIAEDVLTIPGPLVLDVRLGNAVALPFALDGTDGFRHDVGIAGALVEGGTVQGDVTAYDGAYRLMVNGQPFPARPAALTGAGGRQLVLGPVRLAGLDVSRQVFVPAGGGFARFLEVVANPTAVPVPVAVQIEGELASGPATRVLAAPAANGDTYAVTEVGVDGPAAASVAHVFSSVAPAVPVTVAQFQATGNFAYGWTATVPAGGSIAFLHFSAQRPPGTSATVLRVLAESLRALGESGATDALTAAERAAIANFVLP